MLAEEEASILEWLSAKQEIDQGEYFRLRNQLKNYIENNVQLHRQGLKLTVQKLHEKLLTTDCKLRKQLLTSQFKQDELHKDLIQSRCFQTAFSKQNDEKQSEIDILKNEMQEILNENQQLKDEKIRIMGVNTMLEQKIHVERSEMMSMQNDMDVMMHGGAESLYSGRMSGKISMHRKMG